MAVFANEGGPEQERPVILRRQDFPVVMELYEVSEDLQRQAPVGFVYLDSDVRMGDSLFLLSSVEGKYAQLPPIVRFVVDESSSPKRQYVQVAGHKDIIEIIAQQKTPDRPKRSTGVGTILQKLRPVLYVLLAGTALSLVGGVGVKLVQNDRMKQGIVEKGKVIGKDLDLLTTELNKIHAEYIGLLNEYSDLNAQSPDEIRRLDEAIQTKERELEEIRTKLRQKIAELEKNVEEFNKHSFFFDIPTTTNGEENEGSEDISK